jgi:CheY-like chemotaxis protein
MTENSRPVVCVVDDDTGIRESLRFLFEDEGYIVEEAEDGIAALALLRSDPRPRIVLLDRMMAHLDGIQTLYRLNEEPEILKRTVILFMSARNDVPSPDVAALLRRLTFATISKPFDLDALVATTARAREKLVTDIACG